MHQYLPLPPRFAVSAPPELRPADSALCEGGVNAFHSLRFGSPRFDDADSDVVLVAEVLASLPSPAVPALAFVARLEVA